MVKTKLLPKMIRNAVNPICIECGRKIAYGRAIPVRWNSGRAWICSECYYAGVPALAPRYNPIIITKKDRAYVENLAKTAPLHVLKEQLSVSKRISRSRSVAQHIRNYHRMICDTIEKELMQRRNPKWIPPPKVQVCPHCGSSFSAPMWMITCPKCGGKMKVPKGIYRNILTKQQLKGAKVKVGKTPSGLYTLSLKRGAEEHRIGLFSTPSAAIHAARSLGVPMTYKNPKKYIPAKDVERLVMKEEEEKVAYWVRRILSEPYVTGRENVLYELVKQTLKDKDSVGLVRKVVSRLNLYPELEQVHRRLVREKRVVRNK